MIDKGICHKGNIWNTSNCDCECDKSCDFGESLNSYRKVCNSCTIYIVLFVIAFLIIIGISSAYFCFYWYLKEVILKQQFIRYINGKY